MSVSSYNFSSFRSGSVVRLAADNSSYNAACGGCPSRHISLCNVLSARDLKKFSEIITDIRKSAKQVICAEGDESGNIYNIRTGAVRISKMLSDGRRQITGFLFAGDFFGLSCRNKYSYTAEAITDVEICSIPRAKIIDSFRKFPELGERAFDMTRIELEATHEQMLLLGRKTAREKLCSFLLAIRGKYKPLDQGDDTIVDLPMSRSDIADFLGLTVETISRQFTGLYRLGHIELEGFHKVVLKDADALFALAEGD
ncbi:MAG: cyclic nucleotide-binding domain-containing protein [Alphaproteobacteria bacterium]|nr:cyclic nucleotide-binding domain-containing protein [Alphaproteobacteria bacterium]